MRIAFLCHYSAPSICGVWNNIFNTAKILVKKKHIVAVFSSNIIKNKNQKSESYEIIDGIHIYRFPVYFALGENTLFWKYKQKLKEFKPDIIHAHNYRHPHSTAAPDIAKEIGCPCVLTTHAPFGNENRSLFWRVITQAYDLFFGKKVLSKYDKVFAITKTEIPFLEKLGVSKNKIEYIPNGVSSCFFKPCKKTKKEFVIIFLGRISPEKNIECLLDAVNLLKNKNIKIKIVGPALKNYKKKLQLLINKYSMQNIVKFTGEKYGIEVKKQICSSDVLVLPSFSETFGVVLLEAMASGKIVVSSKTSGPSEFLHNRKDSFIFNINDSNKLAEIIDYIYENKGTAKIKNIANAARTTAKAFKWEKITKNIERIYLELQKMKKQHTQPLNISKIQK